MSASVKTGKETALPNSVVTPGVAAGRLPARTCEGNFADLRPPLTAHEAAVAAARCYFCHDAPCVTACPTAIDIPLFVRQIGGIVLELGRRLGGGLTLDGLVDDYDAVFLGLGLAGVNALGVEEEAAENVCDAVDFIAELRQTSDLSTLPVGRHVVVIGGGMTAVDAAVQSKLLGAEDVAMVYRRGRERMNASGFELDHAASTGVRIITDARPVRMLGEGAVREVEFAYTEDGPDGLRDTGETFRLRADQVFKAIGQKLDGSPGGLALEGRRIRVAGPGRTSRKGVWAGGDCVAEGDDLVVTAVAQGRDAAEDTHAALMV